MKEYGLQLYSIRDAAEKSFADALEKTAKLGYTFVEPAGFFGHSANEVKRLLEENGLALSGTHSVYEDLERDFSATVAYHHALGNTEYVIPGIPHETAADVARAVGIFNKYKKALAAEGINLSYHNHNTEFIPNADGVVAFDEFVKNTDVDFEIDTYWVYAAHRDPVEMIEKMKDRVKMIHLKDGDASGNGFPLGEGTAPVAAVLAKARALGMKIIVESETLSPSGLDEARCCIEYLKRTEKD